MSLLSPAGAADHKELEYLIDLCEIGHLISLFVKNSRPPVCQITICRSYNVLVYLNS